MILGFKMMENNNKNILEKLVGVESLVTQMCMIFIFLLCDFTSLFFFDYHILLKFNNSWPYEIFLNSILKKQGQLSLISDSKTTNHR